MSEYEVIIRVGSYYHPIFSSVQSSITQHKCWKERELPKLELSPCVYKDSVLSESTATFSQPVSKHTHNFTISFVSHDIFRSPQFFLYLSLVLLLWSSNLLSSLSHTECSTVYIILVYTLINIFGEIRYNQNSAVGQVQLLEAYGEVTPVSPFMEASTQ